MSETLLEAGATMKFGTVSAVDEKTGMVRVRLPDFDNMRTAWLHVLQSRTQDDKHYDLFDLGEQVVVLLDARGEDGVVLGAIYSSADTPPVTDANEYDRVTHAMKCHSVGTVIIDAAELATLKAPSVILDADTVTCTNKLHAKGDITSEGKILDTTGNSNHHSH